MRAHAQRCHLGPLSGRGTDVAARRMRARTHTATHTLTCARACAAHARACTCARVDAAACGAGDAAERWRRRMWTPRDRWHAHALLGGASVASAGAVCAAWAWADAAALLALPTALPQAVELEAPLTLVSLSTGLLCAAAGAPLCRTARKAELSARSAALLTALSLEGARLLPGAAGASFAAADGWIMYAAALPLVWQCATSAYIIARAGETGDDRRAAIGVLTGVALLALQLLPIAYAAGLSPGASLDAVRAARPGLAETWLHGSVGAAGVVGWSTLGASARSRGVIGDADFLAGFVLRPSAAWLALFALDCAARCPWSSAGEYVATAAGALSGSLPPL